MVIRRSEWRQEGGCKCWRKIACNEATAGPQTLLFFSSFSLKNRFQNIPIWPHAWVQCSCYYCKIFLAWVLIMGQFSIYMSHMVLVSEFLSNCHNLICSHTSEDFTEYKNSKLINNKTIQKKKKSEIRKKFMENFWYIRQRVMKKVKHATINTTKKANPLQLRWRVSHVPPRGKKKVCRKLKISNRGPRGTYL